MVVINQRQIDRIFGGGSSREPTQSRIPSGGDVKSGTVNVGQGVYQQYKNIFTGEIFIGEQVGSYGGGGGRGPSAPGVDTSTVATEARRIADEKVKQEIERKRIEQEKAIAVNKARADYQANLRNAKSQNERMAALNKLSQSIAGAEIQAQSRREQAGISKVTQVTGRTNVQVVSGGREQAVAEMLRKGYTEGKDYLAYGGEEVKQKITLEREPNLIEVTKRGIGLSSLEVLSLLKRTKSPQEWIAEKLKKEQLKKIPIIKDITKFEELIQSKKQTSQIQQIEIDKALEQINKATTYEEQNIALSNLQKAGGGYNLVGENIELNVPSVRAQGTIETLGGGVFQDFLGGTKAFAGRVIGGIEKGVRKLPYETRVQIVKGGEAIPSSIYKENIKPVIEFMKATPSPQEWGFVQKTIGREPMFTTIEKGYQYEVSQGREPGRTQFFLSKLGEGSEQAGTALGETYFKTQEGKYVSPWISVKQPEYQYSTKARVVGKVGGFVGVGGIYAIPVVGTAVALAPFAEATGRRELGPYIIRHPFETVLTAVYVGYPVYKGAKVYLGAKRAGDISILSTKMMSEQKKALAKNLQQRLTRLKGLETGSVNLGLKVPSPYEEAVQVGKWDYLGTGKKVLSKTDITALAKQIGKGPVIFKTAGKSEKIIKDTGIFKIPYKIEPPTKVVLYEGITETGKPAWTKVVELTPLKYTPRLTQQGEVLGLSTFVKTGKGTTGVGLTFEKGVAGRAISKKAFVYQQGKVIGRFDIIESARKITREIPTQAGNLKLEIYPFGKRVETQLVRSKILEQQKIGQKLVRVYESEYGLISSEKRIVFTDVKPFDLGPTPTIKQFAKSYKLSKDLTVDIITTKPPVVDYLGKGKIKVVGKDIIVVGKETKVISMPYTQRATGIRLKPGEQIIVPGEKGIGEIIFPSGRKSSQKYIQSLYETKPLPKVERIIKIRSSARTIISPIEIPILKKTATELLIKTTTISAAKVETALHPMLGENKFVGIIPSGKIGGLGLTGKYPDLGVSTSGRIGTTSLEPTKTKEKVVSAFGISNAALNRLKEELIQPTRTRKRLIQPVKPSERLIENLLNPTRKTERQQEKMQQQQRLQQQQKLQQRQRLVQRQRLIPRLVQKPTTPKIPKVPKIPFIIIPWLPESEEERKRRLRRKQPTAVIPFGRRYGKFRPLGKPTTEEKALRKGIGFLRGTLGATIELRKPTGERLPIGKISKEFRLGKKGTDITQLVQRREKRISSYGEKSEIARARKGMVKFI